MAFPMLLMRRLVWSSCGPTATFYNITSRHHNKRNKNNSKKDSILHLPTCQFHPSKGKALLLWYVMLHSTSSSIKSNTFGIMCSLGDRERYAPFSRFTLVTFLLKTHLSPLLDIIITIWAFLHGVHAAIVVCVSFCKV